jgi:hypothetical protein
MDKKMSRQRNNQSVVWLRKCLIRNVRCLVHAVKDEDEKAEGNDNA